MTLTIAALAAAAAVLAVLVVLRHHHHSHPARTAAKTTIHHTVGRHHARPAAQATTTTTTTATHTSTARTTTQPAMDTVPSLSGDLQTASQRVHEAGLAPVIHYVPSDQARGTVVAQSPGPGERAPAGSQVTINVSSGQGTAEVTVPNTVGMSIPHAVTVVNGAGLHLVMLKRYVSDQSQAGTVVAQSPAAGASAPRGSRVLVYMAAYHG